MTKILLIEDDHMLQKMYKTILTKEGYSIETAVDGRDGLNKANANEPDLIVLDMLMPNMNGLDFLRAYDILSKHPKVKVIAFSNTDQPKWVDEAMALGVKKYMAKYSFSPKAMVGLIHETLAEKGN